LPPRRFLAPTMSNPGSDEGSAEAGAASGKDADDAVGDARIATLGLIGSLRDRVAKAAPK